MVAVIHPVARAKVDFDIARPDVLVPDPDHRIREIRSEAVGPVASKDDVNWLTFGRDQAARQPTMPRGTHRKFARAWLRLGPGVNGERELSTQYDALVERMY